ncbi:Glycosyl transferase group 1 OS=Tsukamurella paurometabola (strain ATCC 8368 / DSM / CCUG 35730/ CIP 100753 / JCM 10117 / KCTC 9821 / NBRC 16120 / NCIMB 702349 / NCTC 13040) OX=521096 GN=Tpau_0054 PE=4 SV=1 [Tsukamurella paurometabola]|uniref:Glycosyl transferase group 1 n=1 Tax=Tsukamurella paurometabola (strain ATCC 8368 / DSM 20162 / CCUG 35730 / CIP 100753 / JCM 10117 / KCTC 9821 / NBRC 16120 / NCIMB 702349 / NCTC 13040) TaxID=521096 RepID=D5UPU0_TSUPD|nr:glycosyltransferase [Tsukamurella paurometabola]ADG76708.1 glycosyl transferase group 1 [Tsukamurella paurometabola DSM 20162]SUP41307.1 Glycosyl transferases group 1 [Tsukamurella paurometabola]
MTASSPGDTVYRIVADSWYAPHLRGAVALDDLLPRPVRSAAARSGLLRGLLLAAAGLRADAVVTTNPSPGAAICLALYGLLGRRRVVLLEYIVHPPSGRFGRLRFTVLRKLLLRRALLRAQVLTDAEVPAYAALHGVGPDRFEVVRWPARFDETPAPALRAGRVVVASGRRTDWDTFLRAADGADWDVRVVCTGADLAAVQSLAPPSATVLHDISADENQAVVNQATVYVIPVPETGASIGQIRVMNAGQAGVPVVASDVSGFAGYLDQEVAVLVPPGDPAALRAAVDALLDDPARREGLRSAARARGGTMDEYLTRIDELAHRGAGPEPVTDGVERIS